MSIELNDIVQDRETGDRLVVIRRYPVRCDDYVVKQEDPMNGRYTEQTVYDFNSRYSYVQKSDPVAEAVYADSLPADPDDLSREGRGLLAENADVEQYAFPISRLTKS